MYSIVIDGQVVDYKFRKRVENNSYIFSIGTIYVGQIFKIGKRSWSVIGKTPNKLCPVDGFRSRLDAAEFLLKLEGYRN